MTYRECCRILGRMQSRYRVARGLRNGLILTALVLMLGETGLSDFPGILLLLCGLAGFATSLWLGLGSHGLPARISSQLTRESGRWASMSLKAVLAGLPFALLG